MEIRKIQKTGGSSFSVSLPKDWIKTNHLKEQDTLLFVYDNETLMCYPVSKDATLTSVTIQSKHETEESLKREIIGSYILGFDEVIIHGNPITRDERIVVRKTIQTLVGFEITDESTDTIVCQNILHPNNFSYEETLEKMFATALAMFRDATLALSENDTRMAEDVIERDYDVDKRCFLVMRQNRSTFQRRATEGNVQLPSMKILFYEGIAVQLERIADHAVKIASLVVDGTPKSSPVFMQLFQKTSKSLLSLLENASHGVLYGDTKEVHQIFSASQSVSKNLDHLYQEIVKLQLPTLNVLYNSLDRLYGHLQNMAEITIDSAMMERVRSRKK